MNDTTDSGEGFGSALAFLAFGPFFVILFVWLICAAVAGFIAMDRDRSGIGFFLATFFFLGPLGVGVALLATRGEMDRLPPPPPPAPAPPKRPIPDGRRRFMCPRCGAESDIKDTDTSYKCWRCGEQCTVKPKVTAKG